MKILTIKISNSQGIDTLIISSSHETRQNWNIAFSSMAQAGDDILLDPDLIKLENDDKDWKW